MSPITNFQDSKKLKQFAEQTTKEIKLIYNVAQSIALEMIEYIRELEIAIHNTLEYLNGRHYEMGDRCINAISFIESATGRIIKDEDNQELACWKYL